MIKIGAFFNIFDKNWQKNNKALLELDFDFFELMPENEQAYSIGSLRKIFKNKEVIIHAPFVEANLLSNSSIIRQASYKYYDTILSSFVEVFNPKIITLHLGYLAFYYSFPNLEQFQKLSRKFPQITVENMPDNNNIWKIAYPNSEKEFDKLLKKIDNKITFDVGHWFKQDYNVYNLVQKYAKRIVNIHIHDIVDGKDHQPLGTGSLDVLRFLKILRRINYANYLTIELVSDNIKGVVSSFNLLRSFLR